MTARTLCLSVAAACTCWSGALFAQTPTAAAPKETASIPDALKAAPNPNPPAPKPEASGFRPSTAKKGPAISNEVKSVITAVAPDYEAPKPEPEKPAADAKAAEADAPKSDVVHLDPVVVQGVRPPIFRERDLYSQKDLMRMALQRYKGLNLLPYFNGLGNGGVAMAMYREDQRLQDMADIKDTADAFARAGSKGASDELKRLSDQTFIRPNPAWTSPVRK